MIYCILFTLSLDRVMPSAGSKMDYIPRGNVVELGRRFKMLVEGRNCVTIRPFYLGGTHLEE